MKRILWLTTILTFATLTFYFSTNQFCTGTASQGSTANSLRPVNGADTTDIHFVSAPTEKQNPVDQPVFKKGANCLFIGHSFFIPVARKFDEVAARGDYSSHQAELVFASGMGGSPGALWDDERRKNRIEKKLASGKIDLLGMTATGNRKSEFQDFQQWIELAVKHNPNTQFFIGHGWTFGGPRMTSEVYAKAIERSGDRLFKTVIELREAYPKNHIHFVDYGKVASEMKVRFDAGEMPGIEKLVGRDKSFLFQDRLIGHGGPMMLELSSLSWLIVLYGAEIDKLEHTRYKADVPDIMGPVIKHNEQFK